MHPNNSMYRIVNNKRYSVNTSTLLASDEYWDGRNWERRGRNIFLYKTSGGAFFRVTLTLWVNELDTLEPVSREEAMRLYESLPEQDVDYETAFDVVVEEASATDQTDGQPIIDVKISMPRAMIAWLQAQPEPINTTICGMVQRAMGG